MIHTIQVQDTNEDFLFELYVSTRKSELETWGWDDLMQKQFLLMQWTAQQRSYALQYPKAEHLLIIFQNLQAGRIIVNRSAEEIVLIDISILADYHNKGIGTALLRNLQAEAADARLPLRLSVLSTNAARRLYERLGFVTTAENGLYSSMEWRTTP
ncbi:GNAT family N-acetyltransferase [Paenibacillus illinoisensis]|uniref:GNAT family N-acetyltransferase n=1 Tax=Paenibacillus illinoisensis TaxID=59845 RepID=UPI00301932E2